MHSPWQSPSPLPPPPPARAQSPLGAIQSATLPTLEQFQLSYTPEGALLLRGNTRMNRGLLSLAGAAILFTFVGGFFFNLSFVGTPLCLLFGVIWLLKLNGINDWEWTFDRNRQRISWRRLGLLTEQNGEFALEDVRDIALKGRLDEDSDHGFRNTFYRVMLQTSRGEFSLYDDNVPMLPAEYLANLVRAFLGMPGTAPGDNIARLEWLIRERRLSEAYTFAMNHALHYNGTDHRARDIIDTLAKRY